MIQTWVHMISMPYCIPSTAYISPSKRNNGFSYSSLLQFWTFMLSYNIKMNTGLLDTKSYLYTQWHLFENIINWYLRFRDKPWRKQRERYVQQRTVMWHQTGFYQRIFSKALNSTGLSVTWKSWRNKIKYKHCICNP